MTSRRYSAFGLTLESAVDLPELSPSSRAPDWSIIREARPAPELRATPLGAEFVYDGVMVRSYANGDVVRLQFDDTGAFDINPATRVIAWYPGPNTAEAAVRADLLGRVIAFAAHAEGSLTLHASAVSIGGKAIAFVGQKHAGKSTLALALVRAGARLLTDDLLIVRLRGGCALAQPGVQRVRLWEDSARALNAHASAAHGAKPTLDRLTPDELESNEVPLTACYVLEAAGAGSPDPVSRVRLTSVEAALSCIRFCKLGALAGGPVGHSVLDRAVELTRSVPVFRAIVRRELSSIGRTASVFRGWYGSAQYAAAGEVR